MTPLANLEVIANRALKMSIDEAVQLELRTGT
jgi:hypothetical protein